MASPFLWVPGRGATPYRALHELLCGQTVDNPVHTPGTVSASYPTSTCPRATHPLSTGFSAFIFSVFPLHYTQLSRFSAYSQRRLRRRYWI